MSESRSKRVGDAFAALVGRRVGGLLTLFGVLVVVGNLARLVLS